MAEKIKDSRKEKKGFLYRVAYYLAVVLVSAFVLYFAFYVSAGNLAPGLPPAPTMRTLQEIYDSLAGTFDSSGVSGSADGNATQMLKCITNKMNGGVCN